MNAEDLLRTAAEDLRWYRTPHTLEQILDLHREALPALRGTTAKVRTNEQIIADLDRARRGGGRGPTGTHSDPTGNAALRGSAEAPPEDETSAAIRARVAELDRNSRRVSSTDGDAPDLLERIRWRILHADPDPNYGIARAIADDALWLRTKGELIWGSSRGARKPAAAQRTLEPCKRCGRWRSGTIGTRAGVCEQCHKFHSNHGAWPTEQIVRRWDYGKGPTPAQIAEAKAAGRQRRL